MHLEMTAKDVGDRLGDSIAAEFEIRIKEKLQALADQVVAEVARDLAREVLGKINRVETMRDGMSASTIVHLYIGKEPPETFSMKQTVVSSKDSHGM